MSVFTDSTPRYMKKPMVVDMNKNANVKQQHFCWCWFITVGLFGIGAGDCTGIITVLWHVCLQNQQSSLLRSNMARQFMHTLLLQVPGCREKR